MEKKNIRELDLNNIASNYNQPLFRAKQLYRWLWKKSVNSFDEITDLPDIFKKELHKEFYISYILIKKKIVSVKPH